MRRDLLAQDGRLLQCRLLEVVHEEPERAGSLQLPRYKVEDAITVQTGCQSSVHPGEDPGRRDVHARGPRPRRGPGPGGAGGRPRRPGRGRGRCPRGGSRARRRPGAGPAGGGPSGPSPSFHRRSRPSSTAAALLDPPPSPPPTGMRFRISISTPPRARPNAPQGLGRPGGQVRPVASARGGGRSAPRRPGAGASGRRRRGGRSSGRACAARGSRRRARRGPRGRG